MSGRAPGWRWDRAAVAGVALALVAVDLLFFHYGTYRAPMFDSASYLWRSGAVSGFMAEHVPLLQAIVGPPAPGVWVPEESEPLVMALAFQGPGYPVFLALWQVVGGLGPASARTANALLHGLSAVLVFVLASRLAARQVARRTAYLALGLFALYLPFTYMAAQPLTETLSVFLLLLCTCLTLWLVEGTWRRAALLAPLLGLALLWLGLTRPAYFPFACLSLPVAAGLVLRAHRGDGPARRWGLAALLGVGFLTPYLLWQVQVNRAVDGHHWTFRPTGGRSIAGSLAESYDVANHGRVMPAAFLGPAGGRVPGARAPLEWVRKAPVESALLRIEKFYRLWKSPATTYVNPIPGTAVAVAILHLVVLMGALAGVVTVRGSPTLLLTLLPPLYTSLVYTAYFSGERRFAFPAMAFLIALCAVALRRLWERRGVPRAGTAGAVLVGLGIAGLAGASLFADSAFLPWPGLDPAGVHRLAVAAFAGVLLVAAWGFAAWVARAGGGLVRAALALALPTCLVVLPLAVHLVRFDDWRTWYMTLNRPGRYAVQLLRLPEGLVPKQVRFATLQLDIRDGDGQVDDLDVRVNGRPVGAPVRAAAMPRAFHHVVENIAPLRLGLDWDALDVVPGERQWLTYDLDPALLGSGPMAAVAVGVPKAPAEPHGATRLYDLSDARLWQPGGYRIVLQLILADGREVIL